MDADDAAVWRPRQVHRARTFRLGLLADPAAAQSNIEADAVVCARADFSIGVVAADCAPVLVATQSGDCVAAVHAGWRGLAAGVLESAVRQLVRASGCSTSALFAAIGPAAGSCCYEVGAEVIAAVQPDGRHLGRSDVDSSRRTLDVRGVASDRLQSCGLTAERIELVGPCSICSQEWPSYRRQGARAGRQLAWIAASRNS